MTETPNSTDSPDISPFLEQGEENRKLVFTLKSQLVTAEWNQIENVGETILKAIDERKKPQVMVDLSELEHMGSSMVALLVNVWKRVDSKDGSASFLSTHDGINQVLKLAGLSKVWTICDTREEALDALGSTTEQTGRHLAKFLVTASIVCCCVAIFMLALALSGKHPLGAQIESKLQIAAGAVAGALGFWAFGTSRNLTKIIGCVSGAIGIGLAIYAIVT